MGLAPPKGSPISTMILYNRKDGHVAWLSTCTNMCPKALRASLGSFLKSSGYHKSMPTVVA
eukprot:5373717-Karenia_brevis.AAC.1